MSEEVQKKAGKGNRFLLGLLYWALLILDGVVASVLAKSALVGVILSAILVIVFIIWPKRKGFWFLWWLFLAIAFTAFYVFMMTKGA